MRKLNVNDFYNLGKNCETVRKTLGEVKGEVVLSTVVWPLFSTAISFSAILAEPCALVSSSARAAERVIAAIRAVAPSSHDELFNADFSEKKQSWQFNSVVAAIDNFETILQNDMPEMSTFAVGQIGIMRTDDLIDRAYLQVSEPLRSLLLPKAKADIAEAGKCLAFRLSTAAAFHACRAIEAGMDQYYEALAGKPYEVSPSGGNNNWGAKTAALVNLNADERATEFLTHIRKQYRNPVTHPEVTVDEHEAVDLFVASLSAISMMLSLTKNALGKTSQLSIAGMIPTQIGGSNDGAGNVQCSDEEDTVSV